MKILKIHENKGFYSADGNNWKLIDEIGKDDLMRLVKLVLEPSKEVAMDEFREESLANQAHQIIYKSIYEKIVSLQKNKNRFIDESHRLYLDAIKKYKENVSGQPTQTA